MRLTRIWVASTAVSALGLFAMPSANARSIAPVAGPCPFSGCLSHNSCWSEGEVYDFCHNFVSCGFPYWCFKFAEECGGDRAVIICNGNEI